MRAENGFTLIEVMVATAIVGMAIMYSASGSDLVISTYYHSKKSSVAHAIAASKMELLLATHGGDAEIAEGDHEELFDRDGLTGANDKSYHARWNVTYNEPLDGVARIDLGVSWQDDSIWRTVRFTSFRKLAP